MILIMIVAFEEGRGLNGCVHDIESSGVRWRDVKQDSDVINSLMYFPMSEA